MHKGRFRAWKFPLLQCWRASRGAFDILIKFHNTRVIYIAAFVRAATGIINQLTTLLGISMNVDINYQNNPLHGVGLKQLITEIVNHYGFEILFAYLNINCFKNNPSIDSSVKFLKKTDWAREKVESFYLYQFKGLPRASAEQFELPPRDRIIPRDQTPGKPAELSLEDAERLREKRAKKAAMRDSDADYRSKSDKGLSHRDSDPWAKWKK